MSDDIFAEKPPYDRSKEFPLYPELSEEGKQEAAKVIEHFKGKLKSVLEEVLGQIYIDVPDYIETDAWTNFRNSLMAGFRNYGNRKLQADYDFAEIRRQIFIQFREEIIKDLDQDNLERIKKLEEDVKYWQNMYHDLADRRNY